MWSPFRSLASIGPSPADLDACSWAVNERERVVLDVVDAPFLEGIIYRGGVNPWVKGSVCFVLKFALPPFSR